MVLACSAVTGREKSQGRNDRRSLFCASTRDEAAHQMLLGICLPAHINGADHEYGLGGLGSSATKQV
eukprot:6210536-Pleurochrysis_carterae.AAC.1